MKTRTVYKVCRFREDENGNEIFCSSFVHPGLEYKLGKKTVAPKGTYLFAFKTLKAALEESKLRSYMRAAVFECKAVVLNSECGTWFVGRHGLDEIITYFKAIIKQKKIHPDTILCKSITPIRLIKEDETPN